MSLEVVLQDLHVKLQHLHDAIHALRMIVVDDQPPIEGTVLVDQFGYAADDLVGWSEEMIAVVADARAAAARNPPDAETVRRKVAGENPVRIYENGGGAGIDFCVPRFMNTY